MKKFLLTVISAFTLLGALQSQVSTYSFTQSSGIYTPITGGVLRAHGTADDSTYSSLDVGFSFKYNGSYYTTFSLNTNGWISLGSNTPSNSYLPISGGNTNNVISAMGKDLQLGYTSTGNYTTGSHMITNVSSTTGFEIGDVFVAATGFPAGTKITAKTASTLTVSTVATSSGSAGIYTVMGEIRYGVLGTAPNRICVIQWKRVRRFGTSTTGGRNDFFNFQIRLYESTNVIRMQYGSYQTNSSSSSYQIGLRGSSNSNYNNRKTTTNWGNTTAGTSNTSTCSLYATVLPSSGQTYTWIPPVPACTGTPVAGVVSGPSLACNGVQFTLSLSNYQTNVTGIALQWQKSSTLNGSYTNITGATSATLSTSQSTQTYYRCNIKCTASGLSVNSNSLNVNMNSATNCYCIPTASDCEYTGLSNVKFASINNSTGCTSPSGYSYYANPNPTVFKGNNYPIVTTPVDYENGYVGVWIDFNRNGVFEASEFTLIHDVPIDDENRMNYGNIYIPATAASGSTRMRVRASVNPINGNNACSALTAGGETEDYQITIATPSGCYGTPTVGSVITSLDWSGGGYVGWGINLTITGYPTNVSGITFQWQKSTTINGTYTNISGATTPSYNTTVQSGTTFYRCKVTCSGSGSTATSGSKKIIGTLLQQRELEMPSEMEAQAPDKTDELEKLVIYPNPNNGTFNFSIDEINTDEMEILIIDAQGKEIYHSTENNIIGSFNRQINIENAIQGIYFIKISTPVNSKVERIIIQ